MADEEREWAQLPLELLQEIAGHLSEITDHLRFGCVCASWRSAFKSTIAARTLPLQFPLVLDLDRLISLSENRTYASCFPADCFPYSFSAGWVLIFPDILFTGPLHPWLLDPVTRQTIPLPPIPFATRQEGYIHTAKLCGPDLVAVQCGGAGPWFTSLHFCRIGETAWRRIDMSVPDHPGEHVPDFEYCDGRLFFIFSNGHLPTSVYDAMTLRKVSEIPPLLESLAFRCRLMNRNLVTSPSGELLQVNWGVGEWGSRAVFVVLRLEEEEGRWAEVSSIGDKVLFFHVNGLMCFDAGDFRGSSCRGNRIYYLDDTGSHGQVEKAFRLRSFDIGSRRVEEGLIFSDVELNHGWRSAQWVVLNPRLLGNN